MTNRLFGMETEYGFAVRNADGKRGRNGGWADHFFHLATRCLPNLPAAGCNGIFLANGARFYMDCGHPEMTTPECANPWDVVRYMHAGERALLHVAGELKRNEQLKGDVMVFKTNVDHGGSGTTWGCHTSFLHRTNPRLLPAQIIPHLVSRIIYTGAGGVEAGYGGLRFTLSPRVAFLEKEVSDASTNTRGIFHTKDETLCASGFHRLHLICGESLCSETALWLNMGATALVVAMIEMGLCPGEAVGLANPLAAMQKFASDPACTATAATCYGRNLTALQIQAHYLALAEAHLRDPLMPPWADRVCAQWRMMLDRIEQGAPASVATTLDWAIKFCLFSERLTKRGLKWAEPERNYVPPVFQQAAASENPFKRLRPEFQDAHQELCEIDTRFGLLGENGIFATLDRSGVLSHRFPGVDNIEHALANPPALGRARWRGECVRRHAAENRRYSASWTGVFDAEGQKILDLSEPFPEAPQWKDMPRVVPDASQALRQEFRHRFSHIRLLQDGGQYEAAFRILQEARLQEDHFEPSDRCEFLRLLAWVQGRRGFLDGVTALEQLALFQPMTFSLANDFVCALRYQGLVPPPAIEPWIEKGRQLMEQDSESNLGGSVPFLDHWGYTRLRNGQVEEARRLLQQACIQECHPSANHGAAGRSLADFADVCRALDLREEAAEALEEAGRQQIENQAEGDYADFTLTGRAKLESNPARALAFLDEAEGIQTATGNVMGETRTLLLKARLLRAARLPAHLKTRLNELRAQRPALLKCRLLAKILDHWKSWTGGDPDPDGGPDFYWWL
jgi:hypothetical protein